MDGLAVLAGGMIALAGGGVGYRLRGLSQKRELSGPLSRIEQLEKRLGSFEEATAADLRYLQAAVETAAERFEKLRPMELQTRLSVLEQGSAAAHKELGERIERGAKAWQEAIDEAIDEISGLQETDCKGLGRRIDGLGERVDKAASLICELAQLQEARKAELSSVEGSLHGRLDQVDGETERLGARIAGQEEKLQQAIDGMAEVSAAQDQLTTLLEDRLGQLQSAITAAQQDAAARRAQLQTPGGPAVMPPIVSTVAQPAVPPSAGFVGVMADLAAAQQQFAERQRAAAAEVFAQPGGGGR